MVSFHKAITENDFTNTTIEPSITSNLAAIMLRMSAYSGRQVTWDEVLASKEVLDGRLDGLKA